MHNIRISLTRTLHKTVGDIVGCVLKVYVGYQLYEGGCVLYDFCSSPDVGCLNNATCTNAWTRAQCVCTSEFYGDRCQWRTCARL